jgi:hypothetical protein
MKKNNLILFLCGIIGIVVFGCNNKEHCDEESQNVKIQEFGDSTSGTQYWLQNIDNDMEIVNLVINSQFDYEKYVASNGTLPAIDFNNYTLLAGRIKTPSSDGVSSQSVTRSCDVYTYNVTIGGGNFGVVSTVYYFAVIEKVDGKVIFNIQYKNP